MPSYAEFAQEIGVRSKNAVLKWVGKLLETGIVSQDKTGRLAMGDRWRGGIGGGWGDHVGMAMLGLVEAGFPTGAEETYAERQSLDDFLIRNKEASYMLTVKGDSMVDAGIREGDLVLVERGAEAKSGDIVIAEVDGAFTMKYLRKRGREVYLEAANPKYKIIKPSGELIISAVVRAVIRKYK
jgi:repressor LexA